MEITNINIQLCPVCNNYKGLVEEKYNGTVRVYCACDLKDRKSPCMVCPNGDKFWWIPISNHKDADGQLCHAPYFYGPTLNRGTKNN